MILLWQHWLIKYRSHLGYDRSLGGVERFYLIHILAKGKQLIIASHCDNDLDGQFPPLLKLKSIKRKKTKYIYIYIV